MLQDRSPASLMHACLGRGQVHRARQAGQGDELCGTGCVAWPPERRVHQRPFRACSKWRRPQIELRPDRSATSRLPSWIALGWTVISRAATGLKLIDLMHHIRCPRPECGSIERHEAWTKSGPARQALFTLYRDLAADEAYLSELALNASAANSIESRSTSLSSVNPPSARSFPPQSRRGARPQGRTFPAADLQRKQAADTPLEFFHAQRIEAPRPLIA